MTINLSIPKNTQELRPKISVIGVGGAGCNAVNNMINADLEGVDFIVANTDGQALANSISPRKIQLGTSLTGGLGAGSKPKIGEAAAEESCNDIMSELADCNMVFITAGMGGGTGTGAAPIISKIAKEKGVLTVGVVTKPFDFEGQRRMQQAEDGIKELQKYVDTLIVIPNQNLFLLANERTTFADAFDMADKVLHRAVSGVTDLMIKPGLINLDFADIRSVMAEMGKAMMGTGEGSGESRAKDAAEAAINNPLLDDVTIKGASSVLINITGGMDMTLFEVDEVASRIRQEVDHDATIIFGSAFDEKLDGTLRVSVVATGIDSKSENCGIQQDAENNDEIISLDTSVKEPIIFIKENNISNFDNVIEKKEYTKTVNENINNLSSEEQLDIEEAVKEKESEEKIGLNNKENLKNLNLFSHKQSHIIHRETFVPEETEEIETLEKTNQDIHHNMHEKTSLIKKISGLWKSNKEKQNINDDLTASESNDKNDLKTDNLSSSLLVSEDEKNDLSFSKEDVQDHNKDTINLQNFSEVNSFSSNNKSEETSKDEAKNFENKDEFDEKNNEEDLEIPAFLRRQAN